MQYCKQHIYDEYYTAQWNFIIFRKLSHMTVTSPNQKWMRVVDTVRRFYHFLLWRGEVYVDLVGNFDPKKMTPNFNVLAKSIISYLGVSSFPFVFSWQCINMLFTSKNACSDSMERAHSITWYKQKRRQNRWASKQVSQRYRWELPLPGCQNLPELNTVKWFLAINIINKLLMCQADRKSVFWCQGMVSTFLYLVLG